MSIIKAIEKNHFEAKEKRGWDKTFWFFDIHGTILKPNYEYGNTPKDFYPYAKEAMQLISEQKDIVRILYTCSHPHEIKEYIDLFLSQGITFDYINENPEVETDVNGYGCYDKKPYMNVLFEDKAGFDPYTDWKLVYLFLKEKYGIHT